MGSDLTRRTATRRQFIAASAAAVACACLVKTRAAGAQATTTAATTQPAGTQPALPRWDGPIIDIHQHTNYHQRSDERLLIHQRNLGATQTILLPSGSPVDSPSTLKGKANGLYAGAGGVETVIPIVEAHPGEYFFFSNEVPDLPDARVTIEKYLKRGGKGIGEQKFNLPCDSKEMEMVYQLAQEYQVPVLMHFQYEMFNTGFENLEKMLKKYPGVTFIGHAQTWWGNIDRNCDPKIMYPKGKVTPGGLTDRYLSDYPNIFADTSAGSGLNALIRDEEHARVFIERHQDRMLFGSDCPDGLGYGPTCTGASCISALRRLSPSKDVARKILYQNAKALFHL